MNYILQPLNEGHEMPCSIRVTKVTKAVAWAKASNIASALTTLLPTNSFSVRIVPQDNINSIRVQALPDGTFINDKTGQIVSL